ncbi:MAG: hypothetical protein ACYTXC_28920 [Nostoc sp.]
MRYETGSKLEKHQDYIASLREKIKSLEKQKAEIELGTFIFGGSGIGTPFQSGIILYPLLKIR